MNATVSLNEEQLGHLLMLMTLEKQKGIPHCVPDGTTAEILETPEKYWSRHNLITLKLEKADKLANG